MASHSSTLAWEIPWTEEPGRLQSMGLQRVGHPWATSLWLFTFMHGRRKWQPTSVFLPGQSQGRAWRAAIYGVAQNRTRLTWLSISRPLLLHLYPTCLYNKKGKRKVIELKCSAELIFIIKYNNWITPVFIAAIVTVARTWKQLRCPLMDGWRGCGTYIQWKITQLWRGMTLSQL